MTTPTDPKERTKAAHRALLRQLAKRRDALAWREADAVIRRVSKSSLALSKLKAGKKAK